MSSFTVKFDGKGHRLNNLSVARTVRRTVSGNPGRIRMIQGDNSSAQITTELDLSIGDQRLVAIALGGTLKERTNGFSWSRTRSI